MKGKSRKHYNETADSYDLRHRSPSTKWLRKKEKTVIDRFIEGRVLDLGCGSGYHLKKRYFGMDISEKMIKKAYKKCNRLLVADMENIPFKDCSFNTILCMFSTINLADLDKSLSEIFRVLKNRGIAIFTVSSINDQEKMSPLRRMFERKETTSKKFRTKGRRLRMSLYSKKHLMKSFGENGFKVIYFNSAFRFIKPVWGSWIPFSYPKKLLLRIDNLPFFKTFGTIYVFVLEKTDS